MIVAVVIASKVVFRATGAEPSHRESAAPQ
jgi:hypothetical protein